MLHLSLDRGHFEDLVEVVDVQDLQRLTRLLPGVVVHLLNELVASVITDLLEQLAEEMGEQRTRCDNTLVRVCITVIEWDLLTVGEQKTANHGCHQHRPAGVENL